MPEPVPTRIALAPEEALQTERLTLVPIRAAHAAVLFELLRDARLYRYIPQDPPESAQSLEARYRRLASRRSPDGREAWLNWAMRVRDSGEYTGMIEATVLPDRTALIAYTVFVPHQRRGCARILDHLSSAYGVEVVAAEVDTRNVASIALVERLGFERVGMREAAEYFKGATSDEYRYELRAERRDAEREEHA